MNPDGESLEEAMTRLQRIQAERTETQGERLLTASRRYKKKDEPTIDECVVSLVRYIEVRAKDVGERMERSKQLRERA